MKRGRLRLSLKIIDQGKICLSVRLEQIESTELLSQILRNLIQGLASLRVKTHIVKILGFVGDTVSVATTQFCCCSSKAALDIKKLMWLDLNRRTIM